MWVKEVDVTTERFKKLQILEIPWKRKGKKNKNRTSASIIQNKDLVREKNVFCFLKKYICILEKEINRKHNSKKPQQKANTEEQQ